MTKKYIRNYRSPKPSSEKASRLMSKIRAKNTKPEVRLRKALWSIGLRYKLHDKNLPGKQDIILKKYKLAIFVDGEFWHGKGWESRKAKIKSNADFWISKIEKNMIRDESVNSNLKLLGYTVIRFWSQDVEKQLGVCLNQLIDFINRLENNPDY